jgi:hypothetical protein
MYDPASLAALTGSGLLAIGLTAGALLKAWHGWLEVRRMELAGRSDGAGRGHRRPEVAELRERVRRLEAIASGADI